MNWLKHIAMLMLSLSIVVAGLPALAKSECPMAAKMQMQQMDMKDCKGCAKTANKQDSQKKNGCCGDMACAAKCSSMSNASTTLYNAHSILLSSVAHAKQLYSSDHVLTSQFLNTQERPPKLFS